MGGRSSSSSSSSNQTQQIDERIGATDNAIVATDGSDITFMDAGAIEQAGILGLEAIASSQEIALTALQNASMTNSDAVLALKNNADRTLEFVDTSNQDENGRSFREIMPWLVGGVSVIAVASYMKKG